MSQLKRGKLVEGHVPIEVGREGLAISSRPGAQVHRLLGHPHFADVADAVPVVVEHRNRAFRTSHAS
jgi:hypothetical protein